MIEVKHVKKTFGKQKILNGVRLTSTEHIEEIIGFAVFERKISAYRWRPAAECARHAGKAE